MIFVQETSLVVGPRGLGPAQQLEEFCQRTEERTESDTVWWWGGLEERRGVTEGLGGGQSGCDGGLKVKV